jgi:hypothetical protein
MLQYKANLGIVNVRYGEYERRLLEFFATRWKEAVRTLAEERGSEVLTGLTQSDKAANSDDVGWFLPWFVSLPAELEFLMSQLILDGCLVKVPQHEFNTTFSGSFGSSYKPAPLIETYALTGPGIELVERLIAAKPLELDYASPPAQDTL